MNKGLYKEREYYYFYKSWKNSSRNSGITFVLEGSDGEFETWGWKDWTSDDYPLLIGATCLARW